MGIHKFFITAIVGSLVGAGLASLLGLEPPVADMISIGGALLFIVLLQYKEEENSLDELDSFPDHVQNRIDRDG